MNSNQHLDNEGDHEGYASSPILRVLDTANGRQGIIECAVPVDGRGVVTISAWVSMDLKATIPSGKLKFDFTIKALEALGATDPTGDIMAALSEDRRAAEIYINGITGEGAKWATINAKRGNQGGMFYNVYPKREPVGDDYLKDLQNYAKSTGAARKKPIGDTDPFAMASKVVAPPPPRVVAAPQLPITLELSAADATESSSIDPHDATDLEAQRAASESRRSLEPESITVTPAEPVERSALVPVTVDEPAMTKKERKAAEQRRREEEAARA